MKRRDWFKCFLALPLVPVIPLLKPETKIKYPVPTPLSRAHPPGKFPSATPFPIGDCLEHELRVSNSGELRGSGWRHGLHIKNKNK